MYWVEESFWFPLDLQSIKFCYQRVAQCGFCTAIQSCSLYIVPPKIDWDISIRDWPSCWMDSNNGHWSTQSTLFNEQSASKATLDVVVVVDSKSLEELCCFGGILVSKVLNVGWIWTRSRKTQIKSLLARRMTHPRKNYLVLVPLVLDIIAIFNYITLVALLLIQRHKSDMMKVDQFYLIVSSKEFPNLPKS